jgi:drug/metabolite transporter (DMT)-like permease
MAAVRPGPTLWIVNSSHDLTPAASLSVAASPRAVAHPLLGVGLVLTAAAVFAVNGTVSKIVLTSGLSALQLVELRCLSAALVFALIAAVRDRSSLRIGLRELGFVAMYGIVGVAMVQWLYFVSIARMPVSISLLIEFTAPLMIALYVRFVRKEAVKARVWTALALILSGLALVAQVWAGLTLDGIGVIAAWLAAVSLATYYVLGEHAVGRRDPWSLAAWSFAAAALFFSVVSPWWRFPFGTLATSVPVGDTGIHAPVGVLVIYVALLGTVAPFALVLTALGLIGAARVGLIGTAEPPLAGLVAWAALGETLNVTQIAGAVVVLTGIVLAETARTPPVPAPPAPAGPAPPPAYPASGALPRE